MAHLKNDLFSYLVKSGIFKDNNKYDISGNKISSASEKTEIRRRERNRVKFGLWRPRSKKEQFIKMGKVKAN